VVLLTGHLRLLFVPIMAAVLLLAAADASAQPRALRERQQQYQQQTESSGETETESLTGAKPTVEAEVVTVPAGTRITARMDDTLDSGKNKQGERFTMTLEADLAVGETIVVPRNSQLYGTIVEAQKGGRLARQGKLVVELKDVMIDGQLHVIATGTYEAAGERQRTVSKTATGALIGGAVDDEDGAKVGAAAGLGVSAATGGKQVSITSGTILEFTLTDNADLPVAQYAPSPPPDSVSPQTTRERPEGKGSTRGKRGSPGRRR